ncbi:MAG: 30S ribosomal protein S19e [Candidatus Aenigmatarchaeota archaeon]|nr:MAG: 30S ribosomal protein S19e [Candidatus Aenigmarchaeota archaeon]
MNIKELPADKLIEKTAQKLKAMDEFKPPEWARFVKTGVHKERTPQQDDWWHIRAAAVMRKVGIEGVIGVERLRKEYGGRKNLGHKPERKRKASGSVIRNVLRQLEAAEFVTTRKSKGRMLAPKGRSFLTEIAREIRKK